MLSTAAWERGGAGGVARGETDAEGAYRLEIYPGGVQTALVEHPRYGRHVAGAETFNLPTALVETGKELRYDIKLRKGVPIRGIAVYADTGEPAKGTSVVLLRMAQQWRGMNDVESVRADESGRFEFPYVTEGTYGLEAKGENGARLATRYAQANQRVTIDFFVDGESAVPEQRLELLAMGGVRGRILGVIEADQYQRPNVYLQYGQSWISATVDDLGVYEMTHVPPMEDAVLQSQNPQAKSEPFAVKAGEIAEVDLDAAKQGVTGVVEDEKGLPVARARVYLIPQSQLQQQLQQYTQNRGWGGALTDEQGRFTATTGNWAGDYWATQKFVAVGVRQGYAVAMSDAFDLPKEGGPGPEVRLVLPRGGVVRGRVEHAGGAPAMNISVSITPKTEQKQDQPVFETRGAQSSYTGFDGSFEISGVGDGVYTIYAYHPEGKIESREVRAGDVAVKLVIEPASAIAGVVVTEGGSPVAYAQVSVIIPKERGEQPQIGQTQANGRFRIGQLANGSYPVEVSPNPQQYGGMTGGFEKKRVEGVAAGTEDLVIVVSEGKGLRGKVEDQAGKPVPGAGVIAMPLQAKQPQRVQGGQPYQQVEMQSAPSATTNGRGEFEIKGVGDGEVEVIAIADGYTPTSQRAVAGGAPVNIRLVGGEVIEGRLLKADGTPLPRVWIWLQPMTKETSEKLQDWQRRGGQAWNNLGGWNMSSATTDAEGRFRLLSLLPGEYRLQAQQQKDEVLPQTTLRTGMPPQTLRYERALTIKGRVTDAAGRPIVMQGGQRAYVNARLGKDQWLSGAMVDESGAFEIRGIPTGATVTLQAWAGNEYKPVTVDAVAGAAGVSIVLEKNEPQPTPPAK
jgi:protocatechuate 3,4-dioxygenase beta subunit